MVAGKAFATEGVTLSGFLLQNEDCNTDRTLENPIQLGAEGAKHFYANLSGKRTKNFIL